jgi:hypothetical protein
MYAMGYFSMLILPHAQSAGTVVNAPPIYLFVMCQQPHKQQINYSLTDITILYPSGSTNVVPFSCQ